LPSPPATSARRRASELTTEGGYILEGDAWWVRTGHPTYDAAEFYAITAVTDPFGHVYTTAYDDHTLLTVSASDPLGHTTTAEHDYRLLTPWQVTDANDNCRSRSTSSAS
jgi:YD repeat-containing protein